MEKNKLNKIIEKEYKSPKSTKCWTEFWGYSFIICLFAGIWYAPMRGRLISTSLISIFFAIMLTLVDNNKEKKFKLKQKKE